MPATFNQAMNGVASEACCPYKAIDIPCGSERCTDWQKDAKKILEWHTIKDTTMMKNLLNNTPLVATMAVHQSFLHYKSNVYHSLGFSDPIVGYHCIALVGYDDEKEAWILRNSWGTGWGESGYCWIQYGDSEIDQEMYQLILNGDVDPDDDDDEPGCKYSRWFWRRGTLGRKFVLFYRSMRNGILGI